MKIYNVCVWETVSYEYSDWHSEKLVCSECFADWESAKAYRKRWANALKARKKAHMDVLDGNVWRFQYEEDDGFGTPCYTCYKITASAKEVYVTPQQAAQPELG